MGLTLAQKELTWAQGQLGKKVGQGECWDFAEQALAQAGAQTSTDLGPVGDDIDYIWGDLRNDAKDIQAGDILQLRDWVVTTTTTTDYTYPDNSTDEDIDTQTLTRPHHTAIAKGQIDANGVLKTFEQNVDPSGKVVQNQSLATRDSTVTFPVVVRNHLNSNSGKVELAKVQKTVDVSTSGTMSIYKPLAK